MDKDFKCPKKYDDPICPECKYVLPDVRTIGTSSFDSVFHRMLDFKYPYGMNDKIIEKVKTNTVGCLEWKKKNIMAACGCGGTVYCKCGYNYDYCYPPEDSKCPFCRRALGGFVGFKTVLDWRGWE